MDCKRINVLIGKPNVGKSNILEALSLFIAPDCDRSKKVLADYIRYEKINNFYYDLNNKEQITVKTNLGFAAMRFHPGINSYDILVASHLDFLEKMNSAATGNYSLDTQMQAFDNIKSQFQYGISGISPFYGTFQNEQHNFNFRTENKNENVYSSPIKKYHFKSSFQYKNHFPSFLSPPYGDNLFAILEGHPALWDECASFFNEYGLDMLLGLEDEIEIQKKIGRRVIQIPYSLAADTLQRMIFHLAAIESNTNSILLLEEPENHSFPPYIKLLAERIIEKNTNQYFIATHSPYILNAFIEQCPPEDLSISIARYDDYETKIKVLGDEEIQNILDTHIDLFFNIRAFEK